MQNSFINNESWIFIPYESNIKPLNASTINIYGNNALKLNATKRMFIVILLDFSI